MSQLGLPLDPRVDFVRHPRARRYVVRVRVDGSVRVTIPRWGSRREAEAFLQTERAWVDRQLARACRERQARGAPLSAAEIDALKLEARRTLPPRLHEIAMRLGLRVRAVSIRDQRWRWGSCSASGRICLNWRLVRMPGWVRDYIIVHELMHLKRMDHSRAFWALVASACPDHADARQWLRTNQDALGSDRCLTPCVGHDHN
jgi:predicted metal-dependent hydrolase